MSDEIPVCPECNDGDISPVTPHNTHREADHKWRCGACHARFDNPRYRQPRTKTAPSEGTVGRILWELPPDVEVNPRKRDSNPLEE